MRTAITELEIKVLFEISQIMGQALNLDLALARILEILSDSMAMKRATVFLEDQHSGNLAIRASHGLSKDQMSRGVYRPEEGITGHIFLSGQPLYVPDVSKEPRFLNKTGARKIEREFISFAGVPIHVHGRPVGVLTVDRLFGEEISPEEDLRFLTVVAQLIGQFFSLNKQVEAREEELRRNNRLLKAEISERYNNFFIVGQSLAMARLHNLVKKVAPSKASVLLLGESGTGKTLVARVIHTMSSRASAPFVKINCAALPENLLESELFGHERGAFTGASEAKSGRVEEAHGGSIFLDEVAELTLPLQAKLLRFLQDREFERLGGTKTRKVDVRIIAATNADLDAAVKEGRFREDLFFRLNVLPILLPPLRERRQDIPLLLDHFVDKFAREYNRRLSLDPQARQVLTDYHWPGNVREMENLVERLAILCEEPVIGSAQLLGYLTQHQPEAPPVIQAGGLSRLDDLARQEILGALERADWVQSRTARALGITLRQLNYRLQKYGLTEMVRVQRRQVVSGGL
ncbi:MAG: sigma 54-interacting transcriptional regulator [Desulfarculus sp.]|nr:sigma 54-interacting transcriptional regulator [Desulfarculus sp.]